MPRYEVAGTNREGTRCTLRTGWGWYAQETAASWVRLGWTGVTVDGVAFVAERSADVAAGR